MIISVTFFHKIYINFRLCYFLLFKYILNCFHFNYFIFQKNFEYRQLNKTDIIKPVNVTCDNGIKHKFMQFIKLVLTTLWSLFN